jgi:tetratricopeptide (TPR) repeat protein
MRIVDFATLDNKGFALYSLGKYNEAIIYYDKSLAIDPNYTTALNNKALALLKLEKYNLDRMIP